MVENPKLLSKMLKVQKKSSYLYQPGPYWKKNSLRTVREINKKGILNFRSFRNNAGQAFTDSPFVDIRPAYNVGARRVLFFLCSHIPLISKVFESQITLTTTLFKEKSTLEGNLLVQNPSVLASLSKIRIPRDSVRGGCETTSIIDGQIVSNYYIEQSFYVDKINQKIKLSDVRNYLEIGGGGIWSQSPHYSYKFPKHKENYLCRHCSKSLYCHSVFKKFFWRFCKRLFDHPG